MVGSGLGALLLGETRVKEEPECAVTDHVIEEEAELLNEEDCVKEELSFEDSALCGVSEAAKLAGLYLDHVVKDELVLGPEDFHRMNIKNTLYGRAPARNPGWEEFMSRDCFVRLERLPPQSDREPHTADDIYDREDYDKEPICNICGSKFVLKSDLMKHGVIHNILLASTEQGEDGQDVADASNHMSKTAGGCGQAVARARSSRYALRDCCVRLERIPALEHRAPPQHTPPPHSPHKINSIHHDNAGIETYICGTCGKIFQLNQDLIRHSQRCQKRKRSLPKKKVIIENLPYSCVCGKQFKYKCNLKSHNRIHTGEKPYSCDECDKQFAHSSSLLIHKRGHTGEKPYACKICYKQFRESGELKTHSRTHTGEKPYSCLTCKKQFSTRCSFNTHSLRHKGEYPYPCEVCEKRFLTSSDLRVHNKRAHVGYSCKICNEHFTSVESFMLHKRSIHNTGGPVYTCNVCKKKYTNSFNYKEHKLIHTGEKPHSCETCGKRFTRLAHLQVHTRYHTGDKPFSCDTCGKRFVQKTHLTSHERAQHTGEKRYSCDICHKRFTQKTHLNTHKVVHTSEKPYACEICDKRFRHTQTLKIHKRVHTGETPYFCELCGKRFAHSSGLSYHKRIHTGEKPYSCEICKKNFAQLRSAKAHRRSHEAK